MHPFQYTAVCWNGGGIGVELISILSRSSRSHMDTSILLIATSNFDDGTDYHYDAVHLPEWTTQYTI
jgi:hypothetical protein